MKPEYVVLGVLVLVLVWMLWNTKADAQCTETLRVVTGLPAEMGTNVSSYATNYSALPYGTGFDLDNKLYGEVVNEKYTDKVENFEDVFDPLKLDALDADLRTEYTPLVKKKEYSEFMTGYDMKRSDRGGSERFSTGNGSDIRGKGVEQSAGRGNSENRSRIQGRKEHVDEAEQEKKDPEIEYKATIYQKPSRVVDRHVHPHGVLPIRWYMNPYMFSDPVYGQYEWDRSVKDVGYYE